jgi:hypothetical protein
MNKSKIVLAAIGGVTLVGALVAGFFLWQASNAKTIALEGDFDEGTDGLDTVMQKAAALAGKSVFPSQESVKILEKNREMFDEWRCEALNLASRGDKKFAETTSAAFKEFLLNEAKRLSSLPGSADGHLIKPAFSFGSFKEFILDGKLPPEAKLPMLQRQWDDITFVIETLSAAGALEVTGVDVKVTQKSVEDSRVASKKKRFSKRAVANKKQQSTADEKEQISSESYVFTFLARPAGVVNVLNALNVCDRFVTVDAFSFFKEADYLTEAISNKKDGNESVVKKRQLRTRSRRRDAKNGDEEKKVETPRERALRMGIVSDPLCESPLTVSITLTIRDFGTLSADSEEEEKK